MSHNRELYAVYCHGNSLSKVTVGDNISDNGCFLTIDSNVEIVGAENNEKYHVDTIDHGVPEIDPVTNATIYPDGRYSTGAAGDWAEVERLIGVGLSHYVYDSLKVENGYLSFDGYLVALCGDGHVKLPLSADVKFYTSGADASEENTVEQFLGMHGGPGMIIDIENGCVVSVCCTA